MSEPQMDVRIDSKGKYYTKIVSTQRLEVIMRLRSGETVQGTVHVRPNRRLSDELNDEQPFISITGVSVKSGKEALYEAAFIAINRRQIEWVIPVGAVGQGEEHLDDDEEPADGS